MKNAKAIRGLMLAALALIGIVIVVAISSRGGASRADGVQTTNATEQLGNVKLGMTQPQIRQIFGDPDSVQHSESSDPRLDTWRYTAISARFVFKNGRLTEKS